jgi:hypothetical protein
MVCPPVVFGHFITTLATRHGRPTPEPAGCWRSIVLYLFMRPARPRLTVRRKPSSALASCPLAHSQATNPRPQRDHRSGIAVDPGSLLAGPVSRMRDTSSLSTRCQLPVHNMASLYLKSLVDGPDANPPHLVVEDCHTLRECIR